MEHFIDALSDDVLFREPDQHILPTEAHEENPAHRFIYDEYDWDGFKAEGQITIRLTRGFFTFVGTEDIGKLAGKTPFAHVHNCPRTGELLSVRAAIKVDGAWLFLHRFLMSATKNSIIDHVNNLPLDNRREKNLWDTTSSYNNANRFRERTVNTKLKRGVEPRGDRYGGKIKFKGITYHSEETWDTQEPAHQWHLSKFKELHGIKESTPKPPHSYPLFPPRKKGFALRRDFTREEAAIAATF
jgi:hypothetical protein